MVNGCHEEQSTIMEGAWGGELSVGCWIKSFPLKLQGRALFCDAPMSKWLSVDTETRAGVAQADGVVNPGVIPWHVPAVLWELLLSTCSSWKRGIKLSPGSPEGINSGSELSVALSLFLLL